MIKALIKKEWIKLRAFILFSSIIFFLLLIYFWNDLSFQFSTVEPENMMWYRFTFLEYKPYEFFKWFLYLFALTLSFVQFIPEWSKNRVRIIAHLPLKMINSLSLHLGVGLGFIALMFLLSIVGIFCVFSIYYPPPLSEVFVKEAFSYLLGSVMIYLGASSSILDKNINFTFSKLLFVFVVLAVFVMIKVDVYLLFWIVVPFIFFLFCYDSFLSIKEQRVSKGILIFSISILAILIIPSAKYVFKYNIHKRDEGFYLFYSPIKKDFLYQKNFGEHQFEYGVIDGKIFDRKEYESYLPFVYWANLDIQKKLPVKIDEKVYSKEIIKDSRLSLSYKAKYLEESDKIVYPLINSLQDEGIIVFPDNMLYIAKDKFVVYHHDNSIEENLTKELNFLKSKSDIKFPIKNIWGKFTNMKVFDLGYFLQDSKDELYNLRRGDDKSTLKKLTTPKDIVYVSINENKQKQIAGFAIDKNSTLYIIKWHDFEFIPIKLKDFNYKDMDLQIISNPMYYQFRYDDEKEYFISVFDKNFHFIDEGKIK